MQPHRLAAPVRYSISTSPKLFSKIHESNFHFKQSPLWTSESQSEVKSDSFADNYRQAPDECLFEVQVKELKMQLGLHAVSCEITHLCSIADAFWSKLMHQLTKLYFIINYIIFRWYNVLLILLYNFVINLFWHALNLIVLLSVFILYVFISVDSLTFSLWKSRKQKGDEFKSSYKSD